MASRLTRSPTSKIVAKIASSATVSPTRASTSTTSPNKTSTSTTSPNKASGSTISPNKTSPSTVHANTDSSPTISSSSKKLSVSPDSKKLYASVSPTSSIGSSVGLSPTSSRTLSTSLSPSSRKALYVSVSPSSSILPSMTLSPNSRGVNISLSPNSRNVFNISLSPTSNIVPSITLSPTRNMATVVTVSPDTVIARTVTLLSPSRKRLLDLTLSPSSNKNFITLTNATPKEDIEKLLRDIIKETPSLTGFTNIKFLDGAEIGNGYLSKTITVELLKEEEVLMSMFLKTALTMRSNALPLDKFYSNEVYFYTVIYPALENFIVERGDEQGLRNIPKCYGTYKDVVALEDLKGRNFTHTDKQKPMNHQHIMIVLKAIARLHAISFVYKTAKPDEYDELAKRTYDYYSTQGVNKNREATTQRINDFLAKLDPVADKRMLERCENLAEKIIPSIGDAFENLDEYSVLSQSDCHCTNMMFLYKDNNLADPIDIMMVDWQLVRRASPAYDLTYFFYTVASEDALIRQQLYMEIYHKELCKKIKALGGDPQNLYPFEILEKEWRLHSRFGYVMAFNILVAKMLSKDEVVDLENVDPTAKSEIKWKNEGEYHRRMKILTQHMIKHNYI